MKELKIQEAAAIKVYNEGSDGDKQLLQRLFPDLNFNPNIMDQVKSFPDACEILGLIPSDIVSAEDTTDEAAYKKLKVIAKALNEGWAPDWDNSNQYKYYPYFKLQGGFSFDDYGCHCTSSRVGSRLCFKSRELAEYAGKTFTDLYKSYFVIE